MHPSDLVALGGNIGHHAAPPASILQVGPIRQAQSAPEALALASSAPRRLTSRHVPDDSDTWPRWRNPRAGASTHLKTRHCGTRSKPQSKLWFVEDALYPDVNKVTGLSGFIEHVTRRFPILKPINECKM